MPPAITSINPQVKEAGENSFTITVNGSGFTGSSVVRFNALNRTTTFVSSSLLTAIILNTDIATTQISYITVEDSSSVSNAIEFPVILRRGRIILDGIKFSSDPEIYEPLNWDKRTSVHEVIQSGTVIQDFGAYAKDINIKLSSGNAALMDNDVFFKLHQRYRAMSNNIYTLSDWYGNEFQVFITRFRPIGHSYGPFVKYEMECQVRTIVKLMGIAYTET